MIWADTFSYVTFSIGAISCLLAGLWIARCSTTSRNDRTAGIAALALTANWCFAAASFQGDSDIVQVTEIARNLSWIFVLYRLFSNDGRDTLLRPVKPAIASIAFVECLQLVLIAVRANYGTSSEIITLISETSFLFRMLVAIGALVLLHNLFAGASLSSRKLLKWSAAALAGFWAFELNFYTLAYLLGEAPAQIQSIRGLAAGIVAIPFAFGFNPNTSGVEFSPSRTITFRSLSLLVIGAYLLVMLGFARWLDLLNGDLVRLTQVGLVIAAGTLAIVWLPSNQLTGWLRVTTAKHLFKHRYDYRNEWTRFTATIGNAGYDEASLQERAIKALADITDSASGILLTPDEDGALELEATWRWPSCDVPSPAGSQTLASILEREALILDFEEVQKGVDHFGEFAVIPAWLREEPNAWAAVPLLHYDRLVGLVILSRPLIERKLDWEDYDLLSVVGRQLASYLAEQAGQVALLEVTRFDEFNRRMAFIMHDIKNLSSQMNLLLRNAERHADKPEFRKDMLTTLRNSSDKLSQLLTRLGQYGAQSGQSQQDVDLRQIVRETAERYGRMHPITVLRSDQAFIIGEAESLERAVAHLVQNAIEASPEDVPVSIEAFSDGVSGKIQILDNGTGMTPRFVRNGLFKPFVSSKDGGFGIGAFEAREVVRSMGGRIDVESREGLGTRFTVSLPLNTTTRLANTEASSRNSKAA